MHNLLQQRETTLYTLNTKSHMKYCTSKQTRHRNVLNFATIVWEFVCSLCDNLAFVSISLNYTNSGLVGQYTKTAVIQQQMRGAATAKTQTIPWEPAFSQPIRKITVFLFLWVKGQH